VQFFSAAAGFGFQAQAAGIGAHAEEARVKGQLRAGCLGLARESGDQPGTLDDQIGLPEGNLRGAPVGIQFEATNFIDDAFAGSGAKLITEMIGNDQSAVRRLKAGFGLQDANPAAATRYCSSSEQTRGGTADHNYFAVFPARPGIIIYVCHRLICPNRRGCLLLQVESQL
jgi:hypothetical protein